ncbi:MarR family transcriptional regulator [Sphingomonas sp. YL-JM2C]
MEKQPDHPAGSEPSETAGGLDRFIPFQIYRIMAKAASVASADYAKLGISVQEARLLMLLLERPAIRAGELSDAACIEASLLSHMLRHLAAKGFIHRERDPAQRRSVQVFLTERGEAVARDCMALSAAHQNMLLAGFDARQIDLLRATLDAMYANVSGLEQAGSPWPAMMKTGG